MPTLRVTRKAELSYGARRLAVMVDGTRVGFVGNGKTVEFPITPGKHSLWVSLDWTRSAPVDLDVPDPSMIEVRASFRGGFLGSLVYGLVTPKTAYELWVRVQGPGDYFRQPGV